MFNDVELEQRKRDSKAAIALGLAANILLSVAKTTAGIAGGSSALVSDGINSISDCVYYFVIAALLRQATRPPDQEHPYGHAQMESIAALVVGAFVLTTAVAILWSEVSALFEMAAGKGATREVGIIAVWVALATVVTKSGLAWWTRRRGRARKNVVLVALSDDHTSDLVASAGVVVGILLARRGYRWVDPLAGAAVGMFVFRTGLRILLNAAGDLMGGVPSESMAQGIRSKLSDITQVREVEEIRAHRFGPHFVVNLTIGLDGSLSIAEGDKICNRVEQRLYETMPEVRAVHVHFHPQRVKASA